MPLRLALVVRATLVTSSRTDPDDDVVDVTSFSPLDVVEINEIKDLCDNVVDFTSSSRVVRISKNLAIGRRRRRGCNVDFP